MTITLEAPKMPKPFPKKRVRRGAEQLVAELQAKIETIKARAERKRAKANPSIRHTVAAIRSMDKATGAATDAVLRKTLEDARGGLAAFLQLQGILLPGGSNGTLRGGRRTTEQVAHTGVSLLSYVSNNPGQRGEQIAEAMGTDSNTMRRPMKELIADGKVRTKGERRGMRYYPA